MRRHRAMNTDILSNLRNYWERLRDGRVAPYRAELDPRQFEDALEHMFILESLGPNQLRVRLAGMALCEMMGMEVRGMPPEALMAAGDRTSFVEHISAVLRGPCVVELDLEAGLPEGGRTEARMLLLPLRSDFGEVTRVLGCVLTAERPRRAPVSFAIAGARVAAVAADGAKAAERPALPGFADEAAGYLPPPPAAGKPALKPLDGNPDADRTPPRRGHLKIVSRKD